MSYWITWYFLVNLVITVVSGTLMVYCDEKYWKRDLDIPHNLILMTMIFPQIILMRPIAKTYGYVTGFWTGFFSKDYSAHKDKYFINKITIVTGFILMFVAAPTFTYGVISETYLAIYNWNIGRKQK